MSFPSPSLEVRLKVEEGGKGEGLLRCGIEGVGGCVMDKKMSHLCPAMWEDPAVCQVFIGAGADTETKNDNGRSPLQLAIDVKHKRTSKFVERVSIYKTKGSVGFRYLQKVLSFGECCAVCWKLSKEKGVGLQCLVIV